MSSSFRKAHPPHVSRIKGDTLPSARDLNQIFQNICICPSIYNIYNNNCSVSFLVISTSVSRNIQIYHMCERIEWKSVRSRWWCIGVQYHRQDRRESGEDSAHGAAPHASPSRCVPSPGTRHPPHLTCIAARVNILLEKQPLHIIGAVATII